MSTAREIEDALVIGAGPNGLSAAVRLAQQGKRVRVLEAESVIGGAARTAELTLPGFLHDLGSAVHPLAVASPFFKTLGLEKHGLRWIKPPLALAHPLDDGTAVLLGSLEETAESIGGPDAKNYRKLMQPFSKAMDSLFGDILAPLKFPSHPLLVSRFGLQAVLSARVLVDRWFEGERARALFAGLAAHSFLKMSDPASAAIGLVLGAAAHGEGGWPIPRGGAGQISEALASCLRELGGTIETSRPVLGCDDLPEARAVLFDLSPRQILAIGGPGLASAYGPVVGQLKPGPGVFKLDWALSGPIPWKAKECLRAGTVHLGGSFDEIARSEESPWRGEHCERPFVLLSQPTLFDPTRAPEGKHVAWAYCHVPRGSEVDMTERLENQIERFAPGFRNLILHRTRSFPADLQKQNRNLEGGDISGGAPTLSRMVLQPVKGLALGSDPYRIPGAREWWICSASAPPGAGVHGMCGFHAAESALKRGAWRGSWRAP